MRKIEIRGNSSRPYREVLMPEYETVIGLEVHVQVKTESKLFCSCPNLYGAEPNTLVCPVCMGFPGVLPSVNREAVRKTVLSGIMCGCEIASYSKFDRKSYFYPDMPKNYQISQFDLPLCSGGKVFISGKGFSGTPLAGRHIGITRIHLEEDVGKSIHFSGFSGIDFNRAGVPLMEIVSEPDMRGADEAYAYLTALKEVMQYGGTSECDMEKGQMRCDVNVSLRVRGQKEFGTKIEIKNLNSFRAVHRSLVFEMERQEKILASGGKLSQETRAWNDDDGYTFLLRSKESSHDYRYFPDPDLMPMEFIPQEIEEFRKEIPELPQLKRKRFVEQFSLAEYDAEVLTADRALADYFEKGAVNSGQPKILANWIITELLRELGARNLTVPENPVPIESIVELVKLISDGTISGKIAKDVFLDIFETNKTPLQIVKEKGLVQISDDSAIEKLVTKVIEDNPEQLAQYKSGKTAVFQFFIGQVMKLSRGKANPATANRILKEKIEKL